VPDLKYGEEVMAWIKVRPGATVTAEEVKDFCRGKIAHFKIPRHYQLVNELPRTATGVVDKALLRQQAIQELGLEAAAAVKTA
jgi:fatty-acyl-CoA synthase